MDLQLNYLPLPMQRKFHESKARFRGYIGGFGSGKTLCGCMEAIILSLEYPGNLGVIARKTYPELRDTTMRTFFDVCPPEIITSFNKAEHHLKFVNGSEILFRSLDDPEKIKMELGFAYIDEASEVDHESFLMFTGRIRKPNVARRCVFITSNPTTTEHWIYRSFVKHDILEDFSDYELIQASTLENVHLPKDYIDNLLANYPPAWIDRYVKGKFGYVGTGDRIYPGFSEELHVRDIKFIKNKPLIRGWDFGFIHPAVVFTQIDSDDRLLVHAEMQGSRILLDRFADQVCAFTRVTFGEEARIEDYCDPAGNQTNDKSEETSIQILKIKGINCDFKGSSIKDGLTILRFKMDRNTGGKPDFLVHPRCKILIEGAFGGYKCRCTKDGTVIKDEPAPDGYFEHIQDALRYVAISKFSVDGIMGNKRKWKKQPTYEPLYKESGY